MLPIKIIKESHNQGKEMRQDSEIVLYEVPNLKVIKIAVINKISFILAGS